MLKMDLAPYLLNIDAKKLSRTEKSLLEIKLFTYIHKELCEIFERRYTDYKKLIKSKSTQEESMFHVNFTQEMIKDILTTNEYSLCGIATHTRLPQEVLIDVASGINTDPSFELSKRIFELHVTVRRDLYDSIIQKMISEYLSKNKE